jgi:uncharacterized protein (DUF1330 family)
VTARQCDLNYQTFPASDVYRAVDHGAILAPTLPEQTMPKAYWIVHVTVHDPEHYPEYLAAALPIFERYGANFVVRGGAYQVMEGNERERNFVIEFKDRATAVACYHCPEYQAAVAIRQKYSDADLIIIDGPG